MNNLCKYKNIFGEEKKGFHSYRLFNIAIFDLLGTVLIAYLISIFIEINFIHNISNYYYKLFKFIYVFLILFSLGIFLHYIFCVKTTINTMLGIA